MLPALKMDKRPHMPRGEAVKVFENDLQCTESKEMVTWIPQSLATVFPIDFMQRNLNFQNDLLTHLYPYWIYEHSDKKHAISVSTGDVILM